MKKLTLILVGLMLISLPAAGQLIESGIDIWRTPADGSTRADFQKIPIPAGFFCEGSRAFTGSIAFQGQPIATIPEDALGFADTVIQRLDDMLFERGRAETRIQVAALSLVSISPVKTACGVFDVRASLAGEQPITKMTVIDEGKAGGTYSAPLSLNIELRFSPRGQLGASDKILGLVRRVDLEPAPGSRWASSSADSGRLASHILVDANGDGVAEKLLSGITGGFLPFGSTLAKDDPNQTPITVCHTDPFGGHQHCTDDVICDVGGVLGFCDGAL